MFFNGTATTAIYTLSLHDALPIYAARRDRPGSGRGEEHLVLLAAAVLESEPHAVTEGRRVERIGADRKSTRLNSSHMSISYAVFCLKKKMNTKKACLHTDHN